MFAREKCQEIGDSPPFPVAASYLEHTGEGPEELLAHREMEGCKMRIAGKLKITRPSFASIRAFCNADEQNQHAFSLTTRPEANLIGMNDLGSINPDQGPAAFPSGPTG